jgi:soluble lytic murein transglycosylase-like protein
LGNGSDSRPAPADRRVLATALGVLAPVTGLFFLGIAWNRSRSAFLRVESHEAEIVRAARESGIDPPLLAALVYVESGGRASAVSKAGAKGLVQLKPAAADEARRWLARRRPDDATPPPAASDLEDPETNLRLASGYLALLAARFGDPDLALAAYAKGPTAVQALLGETGGDRGAALARLRSKAGGAGEYVRRVRSFEERFRERGFASGSR